MYMFYSSSAVTVIAVTGIAVRSLAVSEPVGPAEVIASASAVATSARVATPLVGPQVVLPEPSFSEPVDVASHVPGSACPGDTASAPAAAVSDEAPGFHGASHRMVIQSFAPSSSALEARFQSPSYPIRLIFQPISVQKRIDASGSL